MWNEECGMWNEECGMVAFGDEELRMWNEECGMWNGRLRR